MLGSTAIRGARVRLLHQPLPLRDRDIGTIIGRRGSRSAGRSARALRSQRAQILWQYWSRRPCSRQRRTHAWLTGRGGGAGGFTDCCGVAWAVGCGATWFAGIWGADCAAGCGASWFAGTGGAACAAGCGADCADGGCTDGAATAGAGPIGAAGACGTDPGVATFAGLPLRFGAGTLAGGTPLVQRAWQV